MMDNIEKMTIDTQDTGISQIKQQQTLHTTGQFVGINIIIQNDMN
jgi:hypothetical protein